jgi:hypothetical protein
MNIDNLTPEQKRVLIARFAGWREEPATRETPIERDGMKLPNHFGPSVVAWWNTDVKGVWVTPPDYLNDLNAIHDAEKKLSDEQWEDFADNLLFYTDPNAAYSNYSSVRRACTATAAQRADALLLCLPEPVKP